MPSRRLSQYWPKAANIIRHVRFLYQAFGRTAGKGTIAPPPPTQHTEGACIIEGIVDIFLRIVTPTPRVGTPLGYITVRIEQSPGVRLELANWPGLVRTL